MKDKNLPNDYSDLSLEQLTNEANKMIEYLENQKDLENSMENYQNLIKLNNIIEKKQKSRRRRLNIANEEIDDGLEFTEESENEAIDKEIEN